MRVQRSKGRVLATCVLMGVISFAASRTSVAQIIDATLIVASSVPPKSPPDDDPVRYGLTRADMQRLIDGVPTLKSAIPVREMPAQARAEERSSDVTLIGTTPDYVIPMHLKVNFGRFLTDSDVRTTQNVAVISADLAETLFPDMPPIGRHIQVAELQLQVVGVAKPVRAPWERRANERQEGDAKAAPQDKSLQLVWMPITTMRLRIGDVIVRQQDGAVRREHLEISHLLMNVDHPQSVAETAEVAERILRVQHSDGDIQLQTFLPK